MVTLTFMVVVADVADYKAMWSRWAGLGVIYQGGHRLSNRHRPHRRREQRAPDIGTQAAETRDGQWSA